MEKLILKNDLGHIYYTCEFDRNNNWIYTNWFGYASMDEVKTAANSYLGLIETTRCPNLLNDVRLLNCPWEDAGQWIINDWAPRAAEAGIRHLAHVTMPKAYTEVWIKSMEKHSDNFSLKMFKSLEEAQAWLKGNMPALSLDEDALLGESSYIRSSAYLEKDLKITA